MLDINHNDVQSFMDSLAAAVARQIESIVILPLHGSSHEVTSVEDAVRFIESYNEHESPSRFERYEIQIRFNNGNEIRGRFNDKASAIEFLQIYQLA